MSTGAPRARKKWPVANAVPPLRRCVPAKIPGVVCSSSVLWEATRHDATAAARRTDIDSDVSDVTLIYLTTVPHHYR